MRLLFRKSFRFGPLRVNVGRRGVSSVGLKIGPWSWNGRTRRHRIDLPGPFSWQSAGRRRAKTTEQDKPK